MAWATLGAPCTPTIECMFDTATDPDFGHARPPHEIDALEHEIADLASHITAATARWLKHVARMDASGADFGEGQTSAHWLAWRCSLSLYAARDYVRVARALGDLPKISAAFDAGRISYQKVSSLTKIATPDMEDTLLMWAATGTAAQINKIVTAYQQVVASAELGEVEMRHAERYLDHFVNERGAFVIRGLLDPEEGAIVAKALEAMMDAHPNEEDSFDQRRADALVVMAEAALDAEREDSRTADRYQVVVHVDADALAGAESERHGELFPDVSIHSETARRLACDAPTVTILEKAGEPLSIGRKSRRIPTNIRRAMTARDRGCRWPGCPNKRWIDGHHIEHWGRGGETSLANLVTLCRRHHRKVHEGRFGLRRKPDGELEFVSPHGWIVEASPPIGPPARERPPLNTATLPATYVDHCDYEMAVAALLT